MKNNNGFTLIELIVTVALLAVLSVVVGLSVTNMMDGQKEKQYEEYVSTLEEAGCVYAEHNKLTASVCSSSPASCKVKLNSLISAGLVKKDLTNPNNKKLISQNTTSYIQISWSNNEKKCVYKEA